MPDVTIKRLGHHGDGIADGPVFAPLTLPGEVVCGDISGDRLASPKIMTPSQHRVSAPCAHFRNCGGCALQHASEGFVDAWRAEVVQFAMTAQGLPFPMRNLHKSPAGTRRRATLAARRTKQGALVGFHARASDTIIKIPDCRVLQPQIVSFLPEIERLAQKIGSRKGVLRFAITATDTGLDLAIRGAKQVDADMRMALAAVPVARLTLDSELVAQHHLPVLHIDGIAVTPPPAGFLQATADGERALIQAVRGAIGNAAHIVDLFSGCGTFSLPLSRDAKVHAVESDTASLRALSDAWRRMPLKALTTEARDLFRNPIVAAQLAPFDAAVIDPPRAGAEAQVEELARSAIGRVAMVSCNPETFARDAKTLIHAGFTLNWIDLVDQFRWSPHIELVGSFTR